jgi:glycosyltransferase involved in cell wall biosynthesis
MSRRRAAFFLLRADYFGRTFEDGILRALDAAGFDVDLFAPEGELPQTLYPHVQRRDVTYRRSWLQQNLRPARWRAYDLFLGTVDLPMAFAGTLAALARRPVVTACDEIFLGGYEGDARTYWRSMTRWAMRQAAFTVITDPVRIPLQREYAGLPSSHEFIQYPCCYADPYAGPSHAEARRGLGVGDDDFLLSCTGSFTSWNGAQWIVPLACRDGLRVLVQTAGAREPVIDALLARSDGILHRPERLGFREAAELTVAADASFVGYLSPFPQFRFMGVSSQKLCTSLWLGVPVIATRQESFAFVEDLGCGVLIDAEEELPAAIARIRHDREGYAARAKAAVAAYIRPPERLEALAERFRKV